MGRSGRVGGGCLGFWAGWGVETKVSGNFYKVVAQAVAQAVLLFGAETWVLT